MPRRPPLGGLLALPLLLAGCTQSSSPRSATSLGPVPVAEPAGSAPLAISACTALLARLPAELAPDARRRPVTPDSGRTAAWGAPPITLQCGVPVGSLQDQPFGADGVTWAIHDIGAAQRWTTSDRGVNISLDIPDHYDAQAELIIGLSPAIKATLPTPKPAPGG